MFARFFIAVMFCAFAGCAVSSTTTRQKTHVVIIRHMAFVPSELDVSQGDAIIWKNEDMVPHTATSEKGSSDSKFDSREIKAGDSWTYVPRTKGTSAYICTYHPTKNGTLIVH